MSLIRPVSISEGRIGANVAGDGREFGLIGNGVAIDGSLELGRVYLLRRPSDAVALGIDADYDTNNDVNVWRHISEFYRMAGEGKKLWIFLVGQEAGEPSEYGEAVLYLQTEAEGNISDMALVYNPPADYEPTLVDGVEDWLREAISQAQNMANILSVMDMPLHVIIEGRDIGGAALVTNLRADAINAPKVTVVAGQDWDYADGLWPHGQKFADVGTFLGVVAAQPWNRNPGEVATRNLTDTALKIWLVGGLSSHDKITQLDVMMSGVLAGLDDNGYVLPIRYQGLSGYWWNDGHVCAPIVVDSAGNMNQHTIYYSHTIDEVTRALRTAYLPEIKKPVQLDGSGKLPASMVDYYNAVGDAVFTRLASKGLISDGATYVDPNSDMLVDKELKVQFAVVPTGSVNQITGIINLKNS